MQRHFREVVAAFFHENTSLSLSLCLSFMALRWESQVKKHTSNKIVVLIPQTKTTWFTKNLYTKQIEARTLHI